MQQIERRSKISKDEFQQNYLMNNTPVIITDAMNNWHMKNLWTPEYLLNNYGKEEVQLYDDLFNLQNIITVEEYIKKYFSKENISMDCVPYVRWYTRLRQYEFAWADNFFNKIVWLLTNIMNQPINLLQMIQK